MAKEKIYRLTGIDSAIEMLRPGAKWEISNSTFTRWEDDRPCPSIEEVREVQKKAKEFEDSIKTIWKPEQEQEILKMQGVINSINPDVDVSLIGTSGDVCEERMEIHGQETH